MSSLEPMLNRGTPGRPTAPVDGPPNGPVTQRALVAYPNMVEYVFENTKVRTIPSLRKDCLHGM